jgi:hypothetical protein
MSDSGASSPPAPARNGSPAASPKREDGLADMVRELAIAIVLLNIRLRKYTASAS